MLKICCICKKVTTPGDEVIPSHVICIVCMPSYLREGGAEEGEIAELMDRYRAEKEVGNDTSENN